jgi:hypothetical protein
VGYWFRNSKKKGMVARDQLKQKKYVMDEYQVEDRCDEFENKYAKWVQRIAEMPSYSKSTAYTKLPEYREIVQLDSKALPCIVKKSMSEQGLDFLLCDAIIEISGWSKDEFPATDLGARCEAVVEKFRRSESQKKKSNKTRKDNLRELELVP